MAIIFSQRRRMSFQIIIFYYLGMHLKKIQNENDKLRNQSVSA